MNSVWKNLLIFPHLSQQFCRRRRAVDRIRKHVFNVVQVSASNSSTPHASCCVQNACGPAQTNACLITCESCDFIKTTYMHIYTVSQRLRKEHIRPTSRTRCF
ncbi:hypothetical protein V5799_014848 [Amblyomma americanum]|uniref:Uncharacterized protein n=1 Tax=Amblyomma americanum TaxID=6943 RepID=A0AAQ4E1U6_AMBAM